jgi:magnesium-transporting ATPase (P-type)
MAQLSGIGGWLAVLAVVLGIGFVRNLVDLVQGLSDFSRGWQTNPAARVQLAIILAAVVVYVAANAWVIAELFRKRTTFRRSFLGVWILTALVPTSLLIMVTVPNVTLEMAVSAIEVGRSAATFATVGLWYWYVCVSERVRNTMVN